MKLQAVKKNVNLMVPIHWWTYRNDVCERNLGGSEQLISAELKKPFTPCADEI